MTKRKSEASQGHLIDEVRRIREGLWEEYGGDMDRLSKAAASHAKKAGFKVVPSKTPMTKLDRVLKSKKPAA